MIILKDTLLAVTINILRMLIIIFIIISTIIIFFSIIDIASLLFLYLLHLSILLSFFNRFTSNYEHYFELSMYNFLFCFCRLIFFYAYEIIIKNSHFFPSRIISSHLISSQLSCSIPIYFFSFFLRHHKSKYFVGHV